MGFPEWCLAKEKTWLTISLELFQTQQIASLNPHFANQTTNVDPKQSTCGPKKLGSPRAFDCPSDY